MKKYRFLTAILLSSTLLAACGAKDTADEKTQKQMTEATDDGAKGNPGKVQIPLSRKISGRAEYQKGEWKPWRKEQNITT